jgi:hypothetical protein
MADDRKRPAALDFFTICHKLVFLLKWTELLQSRLMP